MRRTTMTVGVVILLGSSPGCTGSYEERQTRETERHRALPHRGPAASGPGA